MHHAPQPRGDSRIRIGLLWLLALLAALGWWLPWVNHRNGAAALVLLGLDLGDFWKFTNEWALQGLFEWERLCFYLSPPLAAIALSIALSRWRSRWRWLAVPLLLFLTLVVLPAIDVAILPALTEGQLTRNNREYGFQVILALVSSLTALTFCVRPVPDWAAGIVLLVVGLVGAILPPLSLWRTWGVLQGLYGGGAVVGVGVLVSTVGFVAIIVIGVWKALKIRRLTYVTAKG